MCCPDPWSLPKALEGGQWIGEMAQRSNPVKRIRRGESNCKTITTASTSERFPRWAASACSRENESPTRLSCSTICTPTFHGWRVFVLRKEADLHWDDHEYCHAPLLQRWCTCGPEGRKGRDRDSNQQQAKGVQGRGRPISGDHVGWSPHRAKR